MPRLAIRPSRALARLLRDRREALGLTLDEVSAHTASGGELIPPSTLSRIETAKTDPGVRRLVHLLRLYEIPAEQAADLVGMVERGPRKLVADPRAQYQEGLRLAKAGDLRGAMPVFFALREHTPSTAETRLLRQKTLLCMAMTTDGLGQVRVARHILEELLLEDIDASLIVAVLLAGFNIWLALGSLEVAAALLQRAEHHLSSSPRNDPRRAAIEHKRAKLLQREGRFDEALKATVRAAARYRAAGDIGNAGQVRLLRVVLLRSSGRREAALRECRRLTTDARRDGQLRTATMSLLREGQLLVDAGCLAEAEQRLREGLSEAVSLGNRVAEFLAHHQQWKVAEKKGLWERSRLELQAARYYVRYLHEHLPEADEIRSLAHQRKEGTDSPPRSQKRKAPPRSR